MRQGSRAARNIAVIFMMAALAAASLSCGSKQAVEPSFDDATQQQM